MLFGLSPVLAQRRYMPQCTWGASTIKPQFPPYPCAAKSSMHLGMDIETNSAHKTPAPEQIAQQRKRDRLKEALRANLQRRKAQVREKKEILIKDE